MSTVISWPHERFATFIFFDIIFGCPLRGYLLRLPCSKPWLADTGLCDVGVNLVS